MNLNNIDISKLPADVRKELLQLQVMVAEKKIKNRAKDDFMSVKLQYLMKFIIIKTFTPATQEKIAKIRKNEIPLKTKI